MPGKHSRTKGHSFERECARDFQSIGFPDARRHLEYQDGEANGVDIKNTGLFAIQCKRGQQYAPITKIEEVQIPGLPLLITKADKKPAMAVLPWKELMKMIKVINDLSHE